MNIGSRSSYAAVAALALLLSRPTAAVAQTPDPSGHWAGSIQIQGREAPFAVDLVRGSGGELSGAFSIADVDALPLAKVSQQGRSLTFYSRSDQPLTGTLSDDGMSVSGEATVSGYALPFTMKRTGEARPHPQAVSAAVSKELEGTWNGTIRTDALTLRATLTIANQPGGTAIGRLVSLDEGGLIVPIVIVQNGSKVSYEQKGVPGSWAGSLNAEGTELTGTFTQRGTSLPLNFTKVTK